MKSLQDKYILRNGVEVPCIGFGTWKMPDEVAENAVKAAIDTGYRHIDTAGAYRNEKGVGDGIKKSGVKRDEIFLVSKLPNDDHGYEKAIAACESPLLKLGTDYLDGYLIHWPVLVTNWDRSNVEDILMPCMYEDIYRISTGENLKTEDWKIPAEEYERIMTTYFPVSIEQLREYCGYDEGSNSYEYEMIYASPYPPFGEVVDYTKNADGTITLIVDGVWPDYNSDLAFRNTVVVQPFEDGTFRYLSNSIEQIELELPPIARTKG